MTEWLLVLLGVALTAGTAVFVAAEFSFVALDRPRSAGHRRGRPPLSAVLPSLTQLSTPLSAAQVGITMTTLVVGYLASPPSGGCHRPAHAAGARAAAVEAVSTGLALVLATMFSMVFGELLPQFLGISAPLATAKVVAAARARLRRRRPPLIIVLNGSANAFLRALGIEPQEELSGARTPQELASLVQRSAEAGTLDDDRTMLTRSLGFGERTADDVMTPRVRCTGSTARSPPTTCCGCRGAPATRASRSSARTGTTSTGRPRQEGDGRAARAAQGRAGLRADVRPPRVPETIRLDPLLRELREGASRWPSSSTSTAARRASSRSRTSSRRSSARSPTSTTAAGRGAELIDGSWTVPGLWRPDEVRDAFDAEVPDGSTYETMGGFVMTSLGRVPVVGDVVGLPGWRINVVGMEGRRVDRLRFSPSLEPAQPAAPEEEAEAIAHAVWPTASSSGGRS